MQTSLLLLLLQQEIKIQNYFLHFDGTSGIKTTSDDVIRNQDVRITQAGGGIGTATKVILADYSQFGADMRSVSCAVEYGQKGIVC
ncbi:MAG: hypothetical protein CM15mV2_3160 [uncultured marine virus]|nr:MAG: hypothetical protein CM15mV2_3160 [uncultured marine virus]